jgi:predicted  nucleic acid-binding Zn-ribbon protein
LKKTVVAGVAAAGLAAFPALAPADTAPVATVKADLAKLQSNVATARTTLVGDAQKLAADANAAKGTSRKAARAAIKPDLQKLHSDLAAARATIKADHAQLRSDLAAAKQVKGAAKELKPVLASTRASVKQLRSEIRSELAKARQAVKDLRASFTK